LGGSDPQAEGLGGEAAKSGALPPRRGFLRAAFTAPAPVKVLHLERRFVMTGKYPVTNGGEKSFLANFARLSPSNQPRAKTDNESPALLSIKAP